MHSPGEVFAVLPAVLGYFPHDSVLLAGFQRSNVHPANSATSAPENSTAPGHPETKVLGEVGLNDSDKGSSDDTQTGEYFSLGPVLRLDIKDVRLLSDAAYAIREVGADFIFALVVGREQLCQDYGIFEVLLNVASCEEVDILGAWHTEEIVSKAKYRLIFAAQSHFPDADGIGQEWIEGVIPLIAASPAMKDLIAAGELPEINRTSAIDYFRPRYDTLLKDPGTLVANAVWLEAQIHGNARLLEKELEVLQTILDRHRQLPHRLPEGRVEDSASATGDVGNSFVVEIYGGLKDGQEGQSAGRYQLDEIPSPGHATVVWLATWMSRTWLRDCALALLVRHKTSARNLLHEVAISYTGITRANALSLYAALSLGEPSSFRVPVALQAVLEEMPDHRLANLIRLGYQRGFAKEVVDTMALGAETTLVESGVSVQNLRRIAGGSVQNPADKGPEAA